MTDKLFSQPGSQPVIVIQWSQLHPSCPESVKWLIAVSRTSGSAECMTICSWKGPLAAEINDWFLSPWMNNSVLFLLISNQELLSRTSLETQKLDLMAEISNLKLKLTSVEKDRLDYEDRFRDTEVSENQWNKLWKLCVLHITRTFMGMFFVLLCVRLFFCQTKKIFIFKVKTPVSQNQCPLWLGKPRFLQRKISLKSFWFLPSGFQAGGI